MVIDQSAAKNIADFIAISSKCSEEWYPNEPTWGPWFRGHKKADWPLVPNIYRYSQIVRPSKRNERNLEDELQQEFIMRAPSFTTVIHKMHGIGIF